MKTAWCRLLNNDRLRQKLGKPTKDQNIAKSEKTYLDEGNKSPISKEVEAICIDRRNEFEKDYDRVVSSSGDFRIRHRFSPYKRMILHELG